MPDSRTIERYDVGVVGAGLAGLTAARELSDTALEVVVLGAGSETALEWSGFMEGAVSSGERVAATILADRERRER
ncbi:FAD-dependent oxidoreductase [Natrarchaeobaculum aegyptiacum]|uniref:FAD-dependent oxidoreductase 2 FAD binding domain-containing protein n=1 Tax=Natrarchaeobaculum aegyptiacum TaxID=745377 RepID=A0A2Z2HTX5_9EURY|nr:FAD-dependent oxidoreductase [Natrarchaeobaculum aegyptiacum]ARS90660.1 hypothetical protein B1756_13605 [Natrarchaeobaculum aegyptiacum]